MITEHRRRAYLDAMQVATWLPRTALPFAAPSNPELLAPAPEVPLEDTPAPVADVKPATPAAEARPAATPVRAKIEVPRPGSTPRPTVQPEPEAAAEAETAPAKAEVLPPPRFSLQLLRAANCLLLVELPTGEPFQSRDPAYLLLKDLLRAAGLPDSPQILGEPVRWPLLSRGNMDQGPDAARDFIQGFVGVRMEEQGECACLWLVGLPAIRFAGEADATAFDRELQVEGLGAAWALPGLELLMDEPERKGELWQAMRRVMRRWKHTE
ncbi:energy transducer TonB [Pseudomonas taiwanensis]|uniref:energy transducer TonB n=1 Tax=Pseudomonas taiwanensis TaxID=470150 RepID=UPI0015BDB49A|nr:energy transducer TonB [Pseudomonas taiwanensis]NWL78519.1 energy transducer TonB [Pseudomonas taiwanensis]